MEEIDAEKKAVIAAVCMMTEFQLVFMYLFRNVEPEMGCKISPAPLIHLQYIPQRSENSTSAAVLCLCLFTRHYLVIPKPSDFSFFLLFGSIFMLFMYRLLRWLFIHMFTVGSSPRIRFPDNWATGVCLHLLYFFVFVHYVCDVFFSCASFRGREEIKKS